MNSIKAAALGIILAFVSLHVSAATPGARVLTLDIAAQPLSDALGELAKQAGLQIVFHSNVGKGLLVSRLSGQYTAEAALGKLLENTGLEYAYLKENAVAIRARGEKSSAADMLPADQMRLAMAEGVDDVRNDKSSEKERRESEDSRQVIVRDKKDKIEPFSDGNVDLPRTQNDAQAYYFFDSRVLEQSGAANIEDFLKTRLTMNTLAQSYSQKLDARFVSSSSSIDLRGLGVDKTLILINGRRRPGVIPFSGATNGAEQQPDLNGIPLAAVERIEVLPTSASGIYGGSAIGGVVNVVLKKDYRGAEVRVAYDDIFDGSASRGSVAAIFGRSFEDGRTQVTITGQWSDAEPLLFGERRDLADRGLASILRNSPQTVFSSNPDDFYPFPGAAPNIIGLDVLTLKPEYGGQTLGSRITHVPIGTAPDVSAAALGAGLLANAGEWNFELPLSNRYPTGLLSPLDATPRQRAVLAAVRRQMTPRLEAFLELSYQENQAEVIRHPVDQNMFVLADAPGNPFTTDVVVALPLASTAATPSVSTVRSLAAGVVAQLPLGWTALADISLSQNRFRSRYYTADLQIDTDFMDGTLNVFADRIQYPLDFDPYLVPQWFASRSELADFNLRGSGPFLSLPWSEPSALIFGLGRRIARVPASVYEIDYPITTTQSQHQTIFSREQTTDSGYIELQLPLVKRQVLPLVHGLELQLSTRAERYTVDAGTPAFVEYPGNPAASRYLPPVLANGEPFRAEVDYTSVDRTFGIKYQPVRALTLRASSGTAFLPPRPLELIPTPQIDASPTLILDPLNLNPSPTPAGCVISGGRTRCPAQTRSGGNPTLKPQNSRTRNLGVIWEPAFGGLRVSAEYYRIAQFDQIAGLSPQAIVDAGSALAERVVRNQNGVITFVDATLTNLFKLETEGWDYGFTYEVTLPRGKLRARAMQTQILHDWRQLNSNSVNLDYVGYVAEGGAARTKTNLGLDWEHRRFTLGWNVNRFGSYRQYGASGGPLSLLNANGGVYGAAVEMQGGEVIPAQMYHDLFFAYSFDGSSRPGTMARLLDGVDIKAGIKNILNATPPFDARNAPFYISYYGDARLRSYWLTLRKAY